MERERNEREKEEAVIAANMQNSKKKLLDDLAEDEAKRDAEVKKMQQLKDEEQKTLFSSLSNGNEQNEEDQSFPRPSLIKDSVLPDWIFQITIQSFWLFPEIIMDLVFK